MIRGRSRRDWCRRDLVHNIPIFAPILWKGEDKTDHREYNQQNHVEAGQYPVHEGRFLGPFQLQPGEKEGDARCEQVEADEGAWT